MTVNLINRMRGKLGRGVAQLVYKKQAVFPTDRRVVSFSFDDFPRTAVKTGARILESYDANGTFYIALGLVGRDCPVGEIATHEDIISLAKAGHEIGGHTFSHLDCSRKSSQIIQKDCLKNKQLALEIGNLSLQSFSYPFGGVDPNCKRIIRGLYNTARTTYPRLNVGTIDLAGLGSIALYRNVEKGAVFNWLDELDRSGGWLIFHSHDVSEDPSWFGCPSEIFANIVEACSNRGFQILPVTDAAKYARLKK